MREIVTQASYLAASLLFIFGLQALSSPEHARRGMQQAAAVNPEDKFELVFKNLLHTLFVERMDQNEEIFVRFMNDPAFQKTVTAWMAAEAYRRLRSKDA